MLLTERLLYSAAVRVAVNLQSRVIVRRRPIISNHETSYLPPSPDNSSHSWASYTLCTSCVEKVYQCTLMGPASSAWRASIDYRTVLYAELHPSAVNLVLVFRRLFISSWQSSSSTVDRVVHTMHVCRRPVTTQSCQCHSARFHCWHSPWTSTGCPIKNDPQIIPPPTVVAGGIIFYCWSFFLSSFFSFATGSPRWLSDREPF